MIKTTLDAFLKCERCCLQNHRAVAMGRVLQSSQRRRKVNTSHQHWYADTVTKWKTQTQLTDELLNHILYQDKNILALNKPNGIPMHGLKYTENTPAEVDFPTDEDLSIEAVRAQLSEQLGLEELYLAFGQQRLFSGVIVFAKHKEAQEKLKTFFRHARANKVFCQKYWVLARGIPEPNQGREDIGIKREHLSDYIMSVKVDSSDRQRRLRQVIKPTIKYSTLNSFRFSQARLSLLQLEPTAIKWDTLQLFLVHKLSPALGDHKYSSRVQTIMGRAVLMDATRSFPAPQVLPDDLANLLHIQETDSSHIPLHIHCKELILPAFTAGTQPIKIQAPLPDFFEKTLACIS